MRFIIIVTLVTLSIIVSCSDVANMQRRNKELNKVVLSPNSFQHLIQLAGIDLQNVNDSLAFLILPIEEACATCRTKVLDSILKYQSILPNDHVVIISAYGGKKTVGYYFNERGSEIPPINGNFILDSTNRAKDFQLYEGQPAFYYTAKGKVYRYALSKPYRIKNDLRDYFSMR